ncbi:hypothetical protein HpBGD46_05690 [Helicobacter pylori]
MGIGKKDQTPQKNKNLKSGLKNQKKEKDQTPKRKKTSKKRVQKKKSFKKREFKKTPLKREFHKEPNISKRTRNSNTRYRACGI